MIRAVDRVIGRVVMGFERSLFFAVATFLLGVIAYSALIPIALVASDVVRWLEPAVIVGTGLAVAIFLAAAIDALMSRHP